ncbi:GNAT family N-acetyltransferase [Verrucosispora sp. WMMD573]|uniref:GNAT family N-acetyltransferase n=1 Tax=Verrucosispora sp. WMMD573 TaxID=3015149 RepID=UPI00248B627A|nr:GNAT family N-acetyltransferase [Verrucosispora sp. WMMD573]WBB52533.1 GNAT family N-acetyltransferase [Verrucosispora sp. WMMD573]
MQINMRPARAEEAEALSRLAMRSKAHWGYDAQFLESCRPDLTLRPQEISARRAVVAETSGRIVGFYTLDGVPPEGELGNLWIDPTQIRRGIGRRLWEHALAAARALGFTALLIDAEPHAEGFYAAMGAERIGTVPSTVVAGRLLPQLRFGISSSTS